MRILVLFDVHRPIGPDETFSVRSLRTEEEKPTEADVLACLRKLGHDVETLAVYDDVKVVLEKKDSFRPDVVFNLCETFFSDRAHEPNIPALLELMKVPYTGAGPDALMLCKDKALAKNEAEALERTRFLHERFESDAMIEEYVEGRELYLGVLGNKRLTVFPPREIFFGEPPQEDSPRFATAKAKWDDAYRKKWKIRNGPAGPLPHGLERKLAELARKVYRILSIRGLGRIDARLTQEGEVVVIEANPNPSLAKEDDFAQAALQVGIGYEALIQKILENALKWRSELG